jgi:hypothetical protein
MRGSCPLFILEDQTFERANQSFASLSFRRRLRRQHPLCRFNVTQGHTPCTDKSEWMRAAKHLKKVV